MLEGCIPLLAILEVEGLVAVAALVSLALGAVDETPEVSATGEAPRPDIPLALLPSWLAWFAIAAAARRPASPLNICIAPVAICIMFCMDWPLFMFVWPLPMLESLMGVAAC